MKSSKTNLIKKLSFLILLLFFNLISLKSSYSQVTQEWVAEFKLESHPHSYARKMICDVKGNILITGWTFFTPTHRRDILTLKYSATGELLWSKIFEVKENSLMDPVSITADRKGNAYVLGSYSKSHAKTEIVLIKYNSDGDQEWEKIYNGNAGNEHYAVSLKADNYGNIYVAGNCLVQDFAPISNYVTIKYDESGRLHWVKEYDHAPGPSSSDWVTEMHIDTEGNVIVTGSSDSLWGNCDIATVKYGPDGKEMWVKRYDSPENQRDFSYSLESDKSGNIYVSGKTKPRTTWDDQISSVIIKYSADGKELWKVDFDKAGYSDYSKVSLDKDGNIFLCELYSQYPYWAHEEASVSKINIDGKVVWTKELSSGKKIKYIADIETDNSGNFYLAGRSNSPLGDDLDFVTIKYNEAGKEVWDMFYDGEKQNTDRVEFLTIDNESNVIVTGTSSDKSYTKTGITTIKYSQSDLSSIEDQQNDSIESKSELAQNFPNPFNPSTTIKFEIPQQSFVKLKVFDLIGREVATLVNGVKKVGIHLINFDGSDLSTGVYFYKIEAENFSEIKKMTLIK